MLFFFPPTSPFSFCGSFTNLFVLVISLSLNVVSYNLESIPDRGKAVEIGKGRIIKEHAADRPRKVFKCAYFTFVFFSWNAFSSFYSVSFAYVSFSVERLPLYRLRCHCSKNSFYVFVCNSSSLLPSFTPPLFKVALLNLGTRLSPAVEAARLLEETRSDVSVTVADARFMKPLDIDLLRTLATENEVLVTLEEGSVGGKCLCGLEETRVNGQKASTHTHSFPSP